MINANGVTVYEDLEEIVDPEPFVPHCVGCPERPCGQNIR